MPKRFTATEIWEEDWFLDIPNEYKLFWYYALSKCDHAGVFKPNKTRFNISTNTEVDITKAIQFFNQGKERIIVTHKNNWWFVDFFVFQYGTVFNINNKLHNSIYTIYNQELINLRTNRGLKEVKWWTWGGQVEDFDTLKEKDKVKDINNNTQTVKQNENGKFKPSGNYKAQGEELFAHRLTEGGDKT